MTQPDMRYPNRAALLSMAVLFSVTSSLGAENWPQWRGPRFDGTSSAQGLPVRWSQDENLRWRVELPGPAASTPVIWDDRIFLTSTKEGSEALLLMAFDLSGNSVWSRTIDRGSSNKLPERLAHETTPASPSPATDGEHVWALFGSNTLVKYDFSGAEIWNVDLASRYGRVNNYFGLSMSPLLFEGRLFLQLLHSDAQLVVALDATTGREVWRQERSTDARKECLHSYASPTPFQVDSEAQAQVLIHGADYITAHAFDDGAEIWRYGTLNPIDNYNPTLRLVSSPIAVSGMVIVPTAKRGPVIGLRPAGAKGILSRSDTSFGWELERGTPDVPSPLVFDGLVYLSGEKGTLTVLELDSGELVYEERVHQSTHRGSPVHADDKILLVGSDGTVSVIRPGRTFEVLAKNELGEYLAASPAIAGDTLYLRTYEALYAFGVAESVAKSAP